MTISNIEFCHQYAYASKEATGRNMNMSYYNGIMYSYNTAIAKKFDNFTLLNTTNYSVTTSAHQSYLRNSLSGNVLCIDNFGYECRFKKQEIVGALDTSLSNAIHSLSKAKRQSTREKYNLDIHKCYLTLKTLTDNKILLKKDLTKSLKKLLLKELNPATVDNLLHQEKKDKERQEKIRLKKLELRRKEFEIEVAEFRNGNKNSISYNARDLLFNGFDIIRLRNGFIQTSQSVSVPLQEALKLFKLAEKCKQTKKLYNIIAECNPNQQFSIGQYILDKIDKHGNCFVGCHKFNYDEIMRCFNDEYLKQAEIN